MRYGYRSGVDSGCSINIRSLGGVQLGENSPIVCAMGDTPSIASLYAQKGLKTLTLAKPTDYQVVVGVVSCIASGFSCLFSVVAFLEHFNSFFKAWFAPRLYLIEYIGQVL